MTSTELDPKYDDELDFLKGKDEEGNETIVIKDVSVADDEKDRGYYGHLSEQQKAQVHQLRMMLEAEGITKGLDTLTLLRFLRARKFDVNASKLMFVEFDKWRKETLLDDLVPTWDYDEREEMSKYYPQFYHKMDKDGRPIYIEKLGSIDLNKMREITTDQRMLDNLAVEYEKCGDPRLPACSKKTGHLVETFCTIMDLNGVSMGKAPQVYEYVKKASVISQNYYPERLGKLYIINAGWAFGVVWSVVKGWLDPVTVRKIHILGGNYSKELLAQIPAENLPEDLGGTCKCEGGCQNSDAGPWQEGEWKEKGWWKSPEAQAKAREALAGTPKDPVLRNKGGETVAADGAATTQETAAVETDKPAA